MRKTFFWFHLTAGCLAGLVILIMSATGVLLTYEKQMIQWAQRDGAKIAPSAQRLTTSELLAKADQQRPGAQSITIRSNPKAPAEVSFGPRESILLNPYTGATVADGAAGMRRFFQRVTLWHRWLGSAEGSRGWQRQVTGACNLAFLFLALSGLYMWWPRKWTPAARRTAFVPQAGLSGKAREFNWHNAMGFWASVPLMILTATASVMSYPWANDLLYRMAGEKAPAPRKAEAPRAAKPAPLNLEGVDALWAKAAAADSNWQTITMRFAGPRVSFNVDAGSGGQPQLRQTLIFARNGELVEREAFSDLTAGRRARSWARFLHTGEALGLAGQTIAGLASLVGVVLVWTGFALAIRRLLAWRKRRTSIVMVAGTPKPPAAEVREHERELTGVGAGER